MQHTWNKKLELRRIALDLKQSEAADKIGVPTNTYGRWERGENKPMTVYRRAIAEAFEIDEEEIFKEDK